MNNCRAGTVFFPLRENCCHTHRVVPEGFQLTADGIFLSPPGDYLRSPPLKNEGPYLPAPACDYPMA